MWIHVFFKLSFSSIYLLSFLVISPSTHGLYDTVRQKQMLFGTIGNKWDRKSWKIGLNLPIKRYNNAFLGNYIKYF